MYNSVRSAPVCTFRLQSIGVALAASLVGCGTVNASDAGNTADTVIADSGPVPLDSGAADRVTPTDDAFDSHDATQLDVVTLDAPIVNADTSVDTFVATDMPTTIDVPVAIDVPTAADVFVPIDVPVDVPSTTCIPAATVASDGHHNAGMTCTLCHTAGGLAPPWTVSGTLYGDIAGMSPVAGATVRVVDATGATIDLVTAANGNFYTAQAVTYPARVSVSRCPTTTAMTISVSSATGCNSCHGTGTRIHLP